MPLRPAPSNPPSPSSHTPKAACQSPRALRQRRVSGAAAIKKKDATKRVERCEHRSAPRRHFPCLTRSWPNFERSCSAESPLCDGHFYGLANAARLRGLTAPCRCCAMAVSTASSRLPPATAVLIRPFLRGPRPIRIVSARWPLQPSRLSGRYSGH